MLYLTYSKEALTYDYFLIAKPKINEIKYQELEILFLRTIKKLSKQGEKQ